MAKIYSSPNGILPVPTFQISESYIEYEKREKEYLEKLAQVLRDIDKTNDPNVGKIIKFPVADGYAMYMVASLSPVKLCHLELMDAWHFQYAGRLTKKDILKEIEREEKIKELFKK